MEEYASARLLELVQRGLAAENIHVVAPVSGGALLPLAAKRAFLAVVVRDHGLLPLMRVGTTLSTAASDPAIAALLSANGPHDLFERWRRLERFTHSRHRVVIRQRGARHIVAEHAGPPGEPPDAAEDALVLGVLTALLSLCGARDVTVTAGGGAPVTVFSDGAFTAPPPGPGSGRWRFAWSRTEPRPRGRAADSGRDEVTRTRRLLAADPAHRWTLGELAAELGVPVRTLQRRLAGAGGFSGLLGTVRAETAAGLLMDGEHSVGVIGFACGYADQPHFTRHFKLRTAMTPAVYRSVFGQQSPGAPDVPGHVPGHESTDSRIP
ncbi:helix-turn-helix transcriptional regulator [Streptomyces qinzhouensis]|uniref:Helix-turn-helix transcriptional regulator n=1 Tax=Streptomyces qinzhouensis TaxID=2599401 RepID=A0A5B8JKA7_9ACTN|nr:helix-turn-helix transcriptional regulator [Streptomyces qinzhouensis]QDY80331.1 helix-turn-helix transcriptional regulator [Streptomyces qinzhouensis]